ncbi:MAG TPA: helix-turn-helix domain-containing protein [Bacillota bacterium]|nr:helix-turn-helix domain-containing protein [Bacillota bacterium]
MSVNDHQADLATTCNVAYAMNVVGGKWKISIIWELADGTAERLSELRRNLQTISEGVLITQLKELERDGLVRRTVYPEVPPHVEYELTPIGQSFVEAIKNIEVWGAAYRQVASQKI